MGDLEASKKDHKTAVHAPGNPTKTGLPLTAVPTAFSPGTMDAYMQQTEKEMKKLVRYGQKMREYARKKDAENVELRSMVEHLQRENERLRRAVPNVAETKPSQNRGANGQEGTAQGHVRDTPGSQKPTRQESIAQRATTTQTRNRSPTKPVSIANTGTVSSVPTHRKPSSHQHPPASISTAKSVAHALAVRSSSNGAAAAHTSASTSTNDKTISNNTATTAGFANPGGPAITGTSSTRLAPDRLAAARERLRLRAEARKSSLEHQDHRHNDTSPARAQQQQQQQEGILIDIDTDDDADAALNDGAQSPGGDASLHRGGPAALQTQTTSQSREQSVLDWANL
jgi:hypothetical protein